MDPSHIYETWFDAVITGDLATVQECINDGIDVDVHTRQGRTALMLACRDGHRHVVDALIAVGVDLDELSNPIDDADANSDDASDHAEHVQGVFGDMMAAVSDPDDPVSADGYAELMTALDHSSAGHDPQRYDECDADDDYSEYELSTALHYAVAYNRTDIVERLIEAGAELEPRAWDLTPPIVVAAARGALDLVQLLVNAGADPGAINEGNTALLAAAQAGHADVVAYLEPLVPDEIRDLAAHYSRD